MRFLYIAMHREWFRDELLAELLPPLEADGTSHLWNAVGRKFTEMTYAEADRLSKKNKEFVKGLFPEGPIYASLLPVDAQEVIGKVGAQTRGVEKMLRRIGFRYAYRVDPFDGGPHFTAPTDEVTLVKASRLARVSRLFSRETPHGASTRGRALVAIDVPESPFFRSVVAPCHGARDAGDVEIGREDADYLGVLEGGSVWVLPLD